MPDALDARRPGTTRPSPPSGTLGDCMIEIEALLPQDWQLIRHVRLLALSDSPEAFTSTYERERAFDEHTWRDRATTGRWFVAVEDNEPVGVAIGVDGWSGDPAVRELVGMWVAPSHRNRGVARLLLGAVSGWARSEGASVLSLGVRVGNHAAALRLSGHGPAALGHPGGRPRQSVDRTPRDHGARPRSLLTRPPWWAGNGPSGDHGESRGGRRVGQGDRTHRGRHGSGLPPRPKVEHEVPDGHEHRKVGRS